MSTQQQWLSATIKLDEGEVPARFAYHHRQLLSDSNCSRSAWSHLEGLSTTELDDYLRDLDELEDLVRRRMEECDGCYMLLALSGAGYRDLVFAICGGAPAAEEAIRALAAEHTDRLRVRHFQSPKFGPFAGLVSRVKDPI